MAASAGIPCTVKDVLVDEAAAAFLESQNIYATPVLSVDGGLIVGFRRERIDPALGLDDP
jgi:arsenate reductase-like glutaredoxin family protein